MRCFIVPGSALNELLADLARREFDRLAAAAGRHVIAPADENDPAVKLLRQDAERIAPPSRASVIDEEVVHQFLASRSRG